MGDECIQPRQQFSKMKSKLCKKTDDNFSFKLSLRGSIMARCGLWAYDGGMTSSQTAILENKRFLPLKNTAKQKVKKYDAVLFFC